MFIGAVFNQNGFKGLLLSNITPFFYINITLIFKLVYSLTLFSGKAVLNGSLEEKASLFLKASGNKTSSGL